jgi:hypothetical protein
MDFCSLLSWSLRTEHIVTLWTVLELVDSKIWLSFEYKSCSLFNLHVCRVFICYHCYCEIKVMKLRSTSIAAILLKCCLCCRSSSWSVGPFYSFFVSYLWLLWCWVFLVINWCSFGSCLAFSLDQSTSFHLLYELPPFKFWTHTSQIIW